MTWQEELEYAKDIWASEAAWSVRCSRGFRNTVLHSKSTVEQLHAAARFHFYWVEALSYFLMGMKP